MKTMFNSLLALSLICLFTLACDPCRKVDCVHGSCLEGDCDCDPCWEKDADGNCTVPKTCMANGSCDSTSNTCNCNPNYEDYNGTGECQEERAKMLGNFVGNEDCTIELSYNDTIYAGTAVNEIIINNIRNSYSNILATVSGDNITIAAQTVQTNLLIQGSGQFIRGATAADDKIEITYILSAFGVALDPCTTILSRD